jgi:hypothetical protein
MGRLLIAIGIVLVVLGLLWIAAERLGLPPGRLPGDFVFQWGSTTVYLPLATGLVLSVLLSLILWLIGRI